MTALGRISRILVEERVAIILSHSVVNRMLRIFGGSTFVVAKIVRLLIFGGFGF